MTQAQERRAELQIGFGRFWAPFHGYLKASEVDLTDLDEDTDWPALLSEVCLLYIVTLCCCFVPLLHMVTLYLPCWWREREPPPHAANRTAVP